jgi:hypothetical protein
MGIQTVILPTTSSGCAPLGHEQRLIQIKDDIIRMFRAHTEPHHIGWDLGYGPPFLALLQVG